MPPAHEPLDCFVDSPRYHLRPVFLAAWTNGTTSTPNHIGASSVEPSVDRKAARSVSKILTQWFGGPPGVPGHVPPAICAIITRLGNRSFIPRTVGPKNEEEPRSRMVVSMLSHFVFLSCEDLGVPEVGVVGTRLGAKESRRASWCAFRSSSSSQLLVALRVHFTHP